MTDGIGTNPGTADLVEQRMKLREVMERVSGFNEVPRREEIGPYVTISRQAGSGGVDLARRVGDELGWSVLDRELVERLADDLELSPEMVELLDETRSSWLSDTLQNLMRSRLAIESSYILHLARVMTLAAAHAPVVLVGRGGHLLLPPERGLRVRVVAPRPLRIGELQRREGLAREAAGRRVDDLDDARGSFIERHFHRNIDDLGLYDLIVDTSTSGLPAAVALVVGALESRGLVNGGGTRRGVGGSTNPRRAAALTPPRR